MKNISIITINKDNADGLHRTIESVKLQTYPYIEHIIIDGNSTDNSVSVIKEYGHNTNNIKMAWISESDNGIFQAMNKGIALSTGNYLQFLNSGDTLCHSQVVQIMVDELCDKQYPAILYGNMIKSYPNGKHITDKSFQGRNITFFDMFSGTLNHSSALIAKYLFEQYGGYDECNRIVSDWIWYYKVILQHNVTPVYIDKDITCFDMTGISNTNPKLEMEERARFLQTDMPTYIYNDYRSRTYNLKQVNRLQKHDFTWKCFNILDTITVKLEHLKKK